MDTGRIMIADPYYIDGLGGQPSELVDYVVETDILTLCAQNGVNFDTLRKAPDDLKRIEALRRRFGGGGFPGSKARFVATQTGHGDGRYSGFAKVEDGRVIGVWVDFERGKHIEEDID